jgi:hypothetical protein
MWLVAILSAKQIGREWGTWIFCSGTRSKIETQFWQSPVYKKELRPGDNPRKIHIVRKGPKSEPELIYGIKKERAILKNEALK